MPKGSTYQQETYLNPKTIIHRVKVLLLLGLDPETVDPEYETWSNGTRGHVHFDQNCHKVLTYQRISRQVRISTITPGRICAFCIGDIFHRNVQLKGFTALAGHSLAIDKFDEEVKGANPTSKLDALRKLSSLLEELEALAGKSTIGQDLINRLQERVSTTLRDNEPIRESKTVELQLLRHVALTLMVDPRRHEVIAKDPDSSLFGKTGEGNLTGLFHEWRKVYEVSFDRSLALEALMKHFADQTKPSSWSQLNFIVEPDDRIVGTLADHALKLWRARCEETLRRLSVEWADKVDSQCANTERDHLIFFSHRFGLENEVAALAEIYKVGEADGLTALKAPKLVTDWFNREVALNWQLSNLTMFSADIDVQVIRTAITLFQGGKSTYADIEQALEAARRL